MTKTVLHFNFNRDCSAFVLSSLTPPGYSFDRDCVFSYRISSAMYITNPLTATVLPWKA